MPGTDSCRCAGAVDRIEPGIELSYEGADMQTAMSLIPKLDIDKALADVQAAIEFAASDAGKKVGVIGYCFGGTLAWLAETRLHPAWQWAITAGASATMRRTASGPVMLHFGKQDTHILAAEVREGSRRASRGGDLLVRRGPRLQLRCARQL